MRALLKQLDRVLRGEATTLSALKDGTIDIPAGGLSVVLIILAASYGVCMGFYGLFNHNDWSGWKQMASSMVKMPALFLLTLAVTFPSLYVFNALVGSKLTLGSLSRLLVAAMSVLVAVLASFGPIVAFFSVTTTSHPFILLLNVAFCALAGFLGMGFLLQTLHRLSLVLDGAIRPESPGIIPIQEVEPDLSLAPEESAAAPGQPASFAPPPGAAPRPTGPAPGQGMPPVAPPPLPTAGEPAPPGAGRTIRNLSGRDVAPPPVWPSARYTPPGSGALDRVRGSVFSPHVKTVFRFWVILFGLVGAQMSWVLRPFIGYQNGDFQWFVNRESNFFEAVWMAVHKLFTGA